MESLMHGLTTAVDGFAAFAPSLIAGLIVLAIGYFIARVLARVTRSLLMRFGFDRLMTRLGLGHRYDSNDGVRWAGKAVYAVVMLITLMQVARIWNLTFVAVGFAALIGYVPHLIAAGVILTLALLVGNWGRDRLARSSMLSSGYGSEVRFLPSLVRTGAIVIGLFMALRELQIAPEIVNIAFTMTLGAVALAGALAFGLGSRDVAGRITQSWYDRRGAGPNGVAGPSSRRGRDTGPLSSHS